jgi:spermidine/putrescine transport system permease protein
LAERVDATVTPAPAPAGVATRETVPPEAAAPTRQRAPWLWAYFWFGVLCLYVPLWVLVMFSFNDSTSMTLPLDGFTLRWYEQIFETRALMASFRVSVIVALVSSVLAVVLGAIAGLAIARTRFPGKGAFTVITLIPLVIPAIALAVALLVTIVMLGIPLGLRTIVIGHTVIAIPYAALLVATRFAGFSPSLEEAALDLGATRFSLVRRIYLPLAGPALVPAFLFALVLSFDDFDMAFFLSGSDATLPVYFFSGLRRPALLPPVVALQSIVVVATTIGIIVWEVVRLRRSRRGRTT